MRRRLLAAAAALVLAVLGGMVLVAYAKGANARAMAGVHTEQVLVVDKAIASGTSATALRDLVRTEELPAVAVVPGAVRDLGQISGQVATVDLKPGEQLLASRFAAASTLRPPGTVAVPAGAEEISVQLDSQRAVGGRLAAGDKVGVFVSLALPDGTVQTHAVLHHVLVSQVQGAVVPSTGATGSSTTSSSTTTSSSSTTSSAGGTLTVTLALPARDAEAVVFGQEHGKLWLSLEPAGADTNGTTVIDEHNVYTEAHP